MGHKILKTRQYINAGGRLYAVTAVPVTPAPVKPVYMTEEQLKAQRQKLTDAGLDESTIDTVLGDIRLRRPTTSVRTLRAAGAGGTCPFFGQDYITAGGIHHPADCGFNKDGKFAKEKGYNSHVAWASLGAPTKS